jgi:membrane protein
MTQSVEGSRGARRSVGHVIDEAPSETTEVALPTPRRRLAERLLQIVRLAKAVVVGFRGEPIGLRAGNLTFVTVTSLVPLAVVVLSLVHQFGADRIDRLVKRFFAELLSPGGEQSVRAFFSATNVRVAGGLSFLVVMVSAGVLLRHLDASLNEIWAVRRKRPWMVSFGLYAGLLLFGPIIIVLSLLGSEGLKHVVFLLALPLPGYAVELGAVAGATAVLSLVYKFAPHAPVPWKSALWGGALAALAWELARNAYGSIASFFLSADMLYGSLGVAPLFLTWVYMAWYIVLAGARFAYAVEHADFHDEFRDLIEHPRSQELIATRIAEFLTRAVLGGRAGLSTRALATALRMPEQRIIDLCSTMSEAGLLTLSPEKLLAPSKPPTELTLADISAAVGGMAKLSSQDRGSRPGQFEAAAAFFGAADLATYEKLKEISWASVEEAGRDGLGSSRKP